MKKTLKGIGILGGLVMVSGGVLSLLAPWMDRWGATDEEIKATFPGDELLPQPVSLVNRVVTIHASRESIYPWIVQMGADKGGLYSYTWLETYLLRCPQINADRIHPEWQNLKVGDLVKMCPDSGPPPYQVALIEPYKVIAMGHQEDGKWVDLWQFVLRPQSDSTTRLILRTRSMLTGGIWSVLHPGIFVMERGMLLGIKKRAEAGMR